MHLLILILAIAFVFSFPFFFNLWQGPAAEKFLALFAQHLEEPRMGKTSFLLMNKTLTGRYQDREVKLVQGWGKSSPYLQVQAIPQGVPQPLSASKKFKLYFSDLGNGFGFNGHHVHFTLSWLRHMGEYFTAKRKLSSEAAKAFLDEAITACQKVERGKYGG